VYYPKKITTIILLLTSITLLAIDLSFEKDNSWILRKLDGAEGYIKYDDIEKIDGNRALLLVKTNSKGTLVLTSKKSIKAKPGKVMQFGGYYRTNQSQFDAMLLFRLSSSINEKDFPYNSTIDRGWGLMSQTFFRALPPGKWARRIMHQKFKTAENVHLNILLTGNPATIYLDKLNFSEPQYSRYQATLRKEIPYPYSKEEALKQLSQRKEEIYQITQDGLLCNGKKVLPQLYKPEHYFMDMPFNRYNDFNKAKISLQHRPLPLSRMKSDPGVVKAPGKYDYKLIDKALEHTLRSNPQARIVIQYEINEPYPNWGKDYPNEVWKDAKNNFAYGTWSNITGFTPALEKVRLSGDSRSFNPWLYPSYASKYYQEIHCQSLRDITKYIMSSPYAKAVVGFMVSGGHDFQFQAARPDFSQPSKEAFRTWLKKYYKNDITKLNTDLKTSYQNFSEIPIPGHQRYEKDINIPLGTDLFTRYAEFQNELSWYVKHLFANTIRKTVKKPIFVISYGNPPHFFEEKACEEVNGVDSIIVQGAYGQRLPGYPVGWRPANTYNLHGKIFCLECDLRTWTYPERGEMYDHWVGVALTPEMWRSTNRKYVGMALANNSAWHYLSMNRYFDDPEVMKEISKTTRAAQKVLVAPDITLPNEVCIVRSEKGNFQYRASQSVLMERPNNPLQFMQLETSGVPYAMHSLQDLVRYPQLQKYKMYVFLHTYIMTKEEEKVIDSLKKSGNTLVFVYASGYSRTGFEYLTKPQYSRGEGILETTNPLTKNLRSFTSMGELFTRAIRLHGETIEYARYQKFQLGNVKKHEILGKYKDGSISAAIKNENGCRIIVLAEPFSLTAEFLNRLATTSGIYTYSNAGKIAAFTNGKFMSLHAICNENVIITLPKEVNKVVDLLNNKNNPNIPIKNGKITLPLTAGQSKWLLFSK
jgi:hypothetical protein